MRIAITGASGLVGKALSAVLEARGDEVLNVTRRPKRESDIGWDPANREIDTGKLAGVDAIIHLAGENVAEGRWTEAKKRRIRSSRSDATEFLVESLLQMPQTPSAFIGASAIGFYGDRGDVWVDETSEPGEGFLPEVCIEWEGAADPLREADVRVTHGRIGLVLTPKGGALAKLLPIFKWRLGGRVGSGEQYMSWIGLEDLVNAFVFLLDGETSGPVNLVTPNPVTNQEFTRHLASALRRPAFLPVPEFAIKLGLGEMGEQLLLSSTRVAPQVLSGAEFNFEHSDLVSLLQCVLAK